MLCRFALISGAGGRTGLLPLLLVPLSGAGGLSSRGGEAPNRAGTATGSRPTSTDISASAEHMFPGGRSDRTQSRGAARPDWHRAAAGTAELPAAQMERETAPGSLEPREGDCGGSGASRVDHRVPASPTGHGWSMDSGNGRNGPSARQW